MARNLACSPKVLSQKNISMEKHVKWSEDAETYLIERMKLFSNIWNPKHPQFKNRVLRRDFFNRIAAEINLKSGVNINGDEVARKWTNLKIYYRSLRQKHLKLDISTPPDWAHFESLNFLQLNDIRTPDCKSPLTIQDEYDHPAYNTPTNLSNHNNVQDTVLKTYKSHQSMEVSVEHSEIAPYYIKEEVSDQEIEEVASPRHLPYHPRNHPPQPRTTSPMRINQSSLSTSSASSVMYEDFEQLKTKLNDFLASANDIIKHEVQSLHNLAADDEDELFCKLLLTQIRKLPPLEKQICRGKLFNIASEELLNYYTKPRNFTK